MKKKMLFMAAIAGLISLGSCVKDDVSGSVEAVRNAKANELNAKANEHNANAALANADAALKNATQSAEVALKQAEAALKAAEAKSAELDNQLKEDRYVAELESVIAGFEAATAASNTATQISLNQLKDALRDASTKDLQFIQNLIDIYNKAYKEYTNAQAQVLNAKSNLQQAKISEEYAAKKVADAIKDQQDDVAKYTAVIEALKEMKQEGKTQEQVDIEKEIKAAEIQNAVAAFNPDNEANAAFAAAVKALKAKYNAFKNFTENPTSIQDVWNSAAGKAVNPSATPAVAADGYNDEDFDNTFFGAIGKLNQMINPRKNAAAGMDITGGLPGTPVLAGTLILPVGATVVWPNDYIEEIGTPETIYGIPGVGFKSYAGVDIVDANAGVTPYTPAWSASPVPATAANIATSFVIKQYRVNERAKVEADKYFEELPNATKATLDTDKKNLDLAIDLLGKTTDKATTKTTMADNKGALTLYAAKAKAEEAKKAANDKLEDEMTALTNAEKALAAAYASTGATRANDIIQAKLAVGRALENIYGPTGYVIAGVPTNYQADEYIRKDGDDTTAGGEYIQDIAANKEYSKIKQLIDALITAPVVLPPGSTDFTYTKGTVVGRDETKSYQADLIKAQGAEKNAEFDINGTKATEYKYDVAPASPTFGQMDGVTQTIGQISNIASQKDNIATNSQPAYDEAAAKVAAYKAAVEAVDLEKYNQVVDDLKAAIDAYNAAYKAAVDATSSVTDLQDEYDVLDVNVQDIDSRIAAAEAALAQAEENLAKAKYTANTVANPEGYLPAAAAQPTVKVWDPTVAVVNPITGDTTYGAYVNAAVNMSWEDVITYLEGVLEDAETNLDVATANLIAAEAALVAAEIDIDGDDEPAEEPAEEPETPEEPAEGGEETPAEGEGEAEGGEEA